ncbi:alpha/beta hydrolase [Hoeflea sp. CAU 1731]
MSVDAYTYRKHEPRPGAPLVFAFHGTGGDENQFFDLVRQMLPDAGVIAPRGDVSEHGANRFFRRTGEGVYDMEDLARRTEKMTSFVRAHREFYPDSSIYGLGYSNGANILASVIFQEPTLFKAAALMHPLIPWRPSPDARLARLKILISAGKKDPICPWNLTNRLVDYFKAQGSAVETSVQPGGHEIMMTELQDVAAFLARQAAVS